MKLQGFQSLGGIGALILCSNAAASFVGLSVTTSFGAPGGRVTCQIWANCSDPMDYVNTIYGSPTAGAMVIESRNFMNTAPGSIFFNPVTSHGNAPSPTEVFGGLDPKTNSIPPVANSAWDSFFTVAVHAGQAGADPGGLDQTANVGLPIDPFSGTSFTTSNGGWYSPGTAEQGRAGWLGDGDPLLRILILQLTVSSTSFVRGTLNIAGIASNGQGYIAAQQTFSSFIPGPGGLALFLATFALLSAPRRRN